MSFLAFFFGGGITETRLLEFSDDIRFENLMTFVLKNGDSDSDFYFEKW